MRTSIILALIFLLAFGFINFFTSYRSAFEADQQCHSILNNDYLDQSNFGCDHDLETRQWILFENGKNNEASKVLRRFRY